MNYYRRYVGDYGRKTTLLSLAEHGAYCLLLDHYYAEECPLPLDMEDVYRIARAVKPEEKRAVEKVLAKFFTQEPDGFHNDRADAEIERAQPAIEAAKRNGSKGGRPPKENPTGYDDETQRDSYVDNPPGFENPPETEPTGIAIRAGDPTTNHQPPTASHHPPKPETPSAEGRKRAGRQPRVTWTEDGGFHVEPKLRAAWEIAYPAINVDQRIAAAHAWLLSNPDNRKSNFSRFLTNWLTKDQDRAPARGGGDKPRERKLAL